MFRTSTLLALAVGCGASSTAPAPPSSQAVEPRIARIERGILPAVQVQGEPMQFSLEDRMREHKIPAVSIAVFQDYKLQWARAYGLADVATATRADEHTTFLAGSISKSVNAVGVLLAVADGTLSLDKPINQQLETWKLPDNELTKVTPVTIRHLLSHTAGTTVHGFPGYVRDTPVPTVQQVLDGTPPANTAAIRVDLAPGTRFRYSGGGTTITQLALTERSKKPYPQVLAERVLGPVGMTSSSYEQVLSPERLAHAAVGHDGNGGAVPGKRQVYPEMAAAGLWTTPTDLAKLYIELALARAGKPSKVPRAVAMQMTTKVIDIEDAPGEAVGLGVFLSDRNGTHVFGHYGSDQGFQANVVASLDGGYGVVIMANSNNGFKIFEEIERTVFAEYGWPGTDPAIVRVALDAAQRAKFAGRYVARGGPIEIVEEGDKLVGRLAFERPLELVATAPDTLVVRADGRRIVLDGSGGLVMKQRRMSVPLARLATRHHLFAIEAGQFDEAVASWRARAKADPKTALEEEAAANNLGYQLLERDPPKAVEVLHLIAVVFPESSNAHDSYGEALARTGDKARAITEYEESIRLLDADPRLTPEVRAARRKGAEETLAKLRR